MNWVEGKYRAELKKLQFAGIPPLSMVKHPGMVSHDRDLVQNYCRVKVIQYPYELLKTPNGVGAYLRRLVVILIDGRNKLCCFDF